MQSTLATTLQLREKLQRKLSSFSMGQLNLIPEGFNNNIFWNAAHIIATQQLLVYSLADARWTVDKAIVKGFRNGTAPDRRYTQDDVDHLNRYISQSIIDTNRDLESGSFTEYTTFQTRTGFTVDSYESAATFNLYHEGLHMGYILSLEKLV